jgi:hypothetical protein
MDRFRQSRPRSFLWCFFRVLPLPVLIAVAMLSFASLAAGAEGRRVGLDPNLGKSRAAIWEGEFTTDVAAFRRAANRKTALVKTQPLFGEQFQDFNVYSGELLAESRQLGSLDPPSSCEVVQEETVKLLRGMSRLAYGIGDAKDLTTYEYERDSQRLLTLPARLTGAEREAHAC